jgi:hypothetical protein
MNAVLRSLARAAQRFRLVVLFENQRGPFRLGVVEIEGLDSRADAFANFLGGRELFLGPEAVRRAEIPDFVEERDGEVERRAERVFGGRNRPRPIICQISKILHMLLFFQPGPSAGWPFRTTPPGRSSDE